MCDLVDMLLQEKVGLEYSRHLLPALLFAHDIVLLAPTEGQLNSMLSVASRLAEKWGLSYNDSKSKIMVIGGRTNRERRWKLGRLLLSEVSVYKYLGVSLSRSLNDSHHIKAHLREKGKALKGLMQSLLSRHLNVNRVVFGDTLWRNVAQPALSHGCGTWFEGGSKTLRDTVQSLQYQIGRAVFNLRRNCNPAVEAVLGDLGWLPLSHHLDCQRVQYFTYLLGLPENRLYLV